MRVLHLVLAVAVSLAVISDAATATAAKSIQDSDPSHQVLTRALSVDDTATEEEERKGGGRGGGGRGGGGRGGGGGGRYTPSRGYYWGYRPVYPYGHSNHETNKKCNRFTNWLKRLFDKSVKKCPKKSKKEEEEEEHLIQRLRA